MSTLESMYGRIHTKRQRSDGSGMEIIVVIPPNTTAAVQLPGAEWSQVPENGEPLEPSTGIRDIRQSDQGVSFSVGSGEYRFTY